VLQEHTSCHAITLIDAYFYHLSTMSAGKSEQSIVNKELAGAPLQLLPGGAGAGGDTCSVNEQVYIDSANKKKVLYLLCIGLRKHQHNNDE
jgi:hypothetical protein